MKRFLTALFFCASLLAALSFWLFPTAKAEENPILTLLNFPAPPPPNPLVQVEKRNRPPEFYDASKPPDDDAPIEELLDYWAHQSSEYRELGYNPKPSERALSRMLAAIGDDRSKLASLLQALPETKQAIEFVKDAYDRRGESNPGERKQLRDWLTKHSPYFSDSLVGPAKAVQDVGEYVSNQDQLLALTRVDWDKAKPIVDRLYANPNQPVSRVLAMWANYRRALDSDSIGDIDKYRDKLKAVVEDKTATDGMRDLAFDALVKEKHWSGLDEWYYKLMEDETLEDLQVDGRSYTGLTTIIYYTPAEAYTDKMIELAGSDNITVRTAAVKNLLLRLSRDRSFYNRPDSANTEIVKALLPWLSDARWVKAPVAGRATVVQALQNVKLPESVPALIAALDEKITFEVPRYNSNVNAAAAAIANAANAMASASNMVLTTNSNNGYYRGGRSETVYPLRSAAIQALSKQADMRAGPALRRILPEVNEYERQGVVQALLNCNAFTVEEQVEAIEMLAKNAGKLDEPGPDSGITQRIPGVDADASFQAKQILQSALMRSRTQVSAAPEPPDEDEEESGSAYELLEAPQTDADILYTIKNSASYAANAANAIANAYPRSKRPIGAAELKVMLGTALVSRDDVDEQLVRAMVERIGIHDKRDPELAATLRKVMLGWKGAALNALLLRDLKNGKFDADAIVKLLSIRKDLREKQQADVYDTRTGNAAAVGISACLSEDAADYEAALNAESEETRTAMLACARLVRARLPIDKVAGNLRSNNKLLAIAAERYLESEDSPEARAIVLLLYPNQAKILGATTAFKVPGIAAVPGGFLTDLFATVNSFFEPVESTYYRSYHGEGDDRFYSFESETAALEKRLQNEVTTKSDLLGVYSYQNNFVRIYKDKAVLSWEDDPARYRERVLEKEEFDNLKGFLAHHKVDRLPPFLACTGGCEKRQLLMLGRNGGRRVFVQASQMPEFFARLDGLFAEMKAKPAALKYWALNQIPGLEIVFAGDTHDAKTVWKNGADLRALVIEKSKSEGTEIDYDSESMTEEYDEGETEAEESDNIEGTSPYDLLSWFQIANGNLAGAAEQPAEAECIPIKDGVEPAAAFGQWKAKNSTVEIRADVTGLYAIRAGKATKLRDGHYSNPILTPNGRWAVVTKTDEEYEQSLVRVNLLTKQEFKIGANEFPINRAVAYITSLNRVIVTNSYIRGHGYYGGGRYGPEDDGSGYFLLNPDTGALQPTAGEVRPLAQQTFRSLQQAGSPTDFWVAMPRGGKETLVGTYDTRNFTFKPVLRLPKIVFDSMAMWVDAASNRVYFVYEGHVLSAPMTPERGLQPTR